MAFNPCLPAQSCAQTRWAPLVFMLLALTLAAPTSEALARGAGAGPTGGASSRKGPGSSQRLPYGAGYEARLQWPGEATRARTDKPVGAAASGASAAGTQPPSSPTDGPQH
jgi:hypothetical protein